VSKYDGVSDEVGSWQTHIFHPFQGPRIAVDTSPLGLDLLACLIIFFYLPQQIFHKVNSLFCLLFHHVNLAGGSDWTQG
jgi:hypothetical protein